MSQTVDRTVSTFAREAPTQTRARTNAERLMDEVIERTLSSGFDAEAFHVMNERDNRLIQDEILGGPRSSKFVYDFSINNQPIRGISAIGARELATYYKGIRHRIVSSTRKVKGLFVFTTYPHEGIAPSMQTALLPELENEPDGYEAVVEVEDIKTGNRMMAAKFESQWEWSTGQNRYYEKPHFATIAQSKAQRNAILMVIPQSVQLAWMEEVIRDGKHDNITKGVLAEKRDGVLRYGAAQAVEIDRDVLNTLLLEQIMGLSEAARTKDKDAFLASAIALRLVPLTAPADTSRTETKEPATRGTRRRPPNAPADSKPPPQPPQDQRSPANLEDREGSRQTTASDGTGQQGGADTRAGTAVGASQGAAVSTAANDVTVGARAADGQPSQDAEADEGAFEAWIVGPDGHETTREPYVDAVVFATDLAALCRANPDAQADLLDVNSGAIGDCMDASEEAKQIIQGMDVPPFGEAMTESESVETQAASTDPRQPPVIKVPQTGGGKPHWPNYCEDAEKSLNEWPQTVAEADAWMAANKPTYLNKSLAAETRLERTHRAVVARLSGSGEQQEDPDEKRLRPVRGNLAQCKTGDMVLTFWMSPIILRTVAAFDQEGRPEMRAVIAGMFSKCYQDLTGRERAFEFPK